jgi:hypothetical protein
MLQAGKAPSEGSGAENALGRYRRGTSAKRGTSHATYHLHPSTSWSSLVPLGYRRLSPVDIDIDIDMAQHAKISSLTDELIRSIVGFDAGANRQAYKHAKEIASRGLRGHQFARTNQFEVVSTFAGLDEKFRVKNRDDLADALQMRLQKLETLTSRFMPDFLSLLLHLTDRPLENTKVEALDRML